MKILLDEILNELKIDEKWKNHSVGIFSAAFLGAFFAHQLLNFVRNASLNKLIRASKSPFPLQRARYSNKSKKQIQNYFQIDINDFLIQ